jgi:predicted Zn-dependent protease
MMKTPGNTITRFLSFSGIILLGLSCAVSHVTGKKQFMMMSEAQEIEMGRQYDPQVMATFGEYKNDRIQAFLQQKGNELAKISHWPGLEYHVKVLDSPVVNAFAVPGGYIYLTRGILAQLNNEAELAGIIGHEMGHITARHSVSQMSKQQLGQMLLVAGMIASEDFRPYAGYAMMGMQLLFLKFSRDDEREADRLGVEYSSKTGYDAHKMADFFLVLNKMNMQSEQNGVPTFLSTHPDPGDRYSAVNQLAAKWQDSLALPSWKVNQDSYLQLIDGIVYGEDPRQGYVEGNTFYHPELRFKFSFPAGWQLENMPAQVNMAPEDGKALMVFTRAPGSTLQESAWSTLNELELAVQQSRNTTVNGMPALVTLSRQTKQDQYTGQQQAIKVLSYFITYNATNYVFHGVAEEAGFNAYAKTFESSMVTFGMLTDAARLNVTPEKVLVRAVQKSENVASTFRSLGVPQNRMNEVALLNNLELTANVQAGRLIKIIGK